MFLGCDRTRIPEVTFCPLQEDHWHDMRKDTQKVWRVPVEKVCIISV
jgi:hypothetical protein